MKKTLLIAALLLTIVGAKAQTNIQEMYDYQRGQFTTTLEMFKTDNFGSTFFFTDIYHKLGITTPTDFYTEIARAINFWQGSKLGALSLHVEWNGGCGIFNMGESGWGGYPVNNAWLFGAEYFLHNESFTNTFTFELMYKRITGQTDNIPVQFTFVWGMQNLFGVRGLSFSGFLDVWGENNTWVTKEAVEATYDDAGAELTPAVPATTEETKLVILSEPQIWYNVGQHFGCEHLMVGGEVELAYNFTGGCKGTPGNKGFTWAPALGIKWAF